MAARSRLSKATSPVLPARRQSRETKKEPGSRKPCRETARASSLMSGAQRFEGAFQFAHRVIDDLLVGLGTPHGFSQALIFNQCLHFEMRVPGFCPGLVNADRVGYAPGANSAIRASQQIRTRRSFREEKVEIVARAVLTADPELELVLKCARCSSSRARAREHGRLRRLLLVRLNNTAKSLTVRNFFVIHSAGTN